MGDPSLGLAPFGDVDDGDEIAVAALEADAPAKCQHLNLAAVGLEVPPAALRMIGIADLLQGLGMGYPFIPWPDFVKLHAQERRAAISIMLHRCVIDAEEAGRFRIEHPHRHRVVVKQQAERSLAPLQRRHVRDRQRENVAEGRDAQPQVTIIAVDFELVAVAAFDDGEQSFDDLRQAQQMASIAQPAPQQAGRRQLEQP